MEIDTKPIPLKPETRAVLKEIQRSTEPTAAYALDPEPAEELLKSITEPMIGGAALPKVTLQQMRWYVRDLSGAFRTRYGYALASQVELAMRRWAAFCLDPDIMQSLLCAVIEQLKPLKGTGASEPVFCNRAESAAVPGQPAPTSPDPVDTS